MSEAKWCDRGQHAFGIDNGLLSFTASTRVRQDDGTFKVVTKTGDSCTECEEKAPVFQKVERKVIEAPQNIDS